MIIVADSSPLISLAILDKLSLLEMLSKTIIVPEEVYKEVIIAEKPYSEKLSTFLKGRVRKVINELAVKMLLFEIDKGEAEAIILALENNINTILVDDYKARKRAYNEGLSPVGTIGILLQAKTKGYNITIKESLDMLIENKIRISKKLYEESLFLAGEK